MFDQTDTRWAPWTVIDGNDKKAGRIAALSRVAEALAAALPGEPPPVRPEMEQLAQELRKSRTEPLAPPRFALSMTSCIWGDGRCAGTHS